MKPGIHPNYQEATVVCSCGNTFTTRSTRTELRTDLCNVCHPFYTGEQRIVDTAGQVERFTRKMETAAQAAGTTKRKRRMEEQARLRAEQQAEIAAQREAAAKEERAKRRAEREKAEADAKARAEQEAASAPVETSPIESAEASQEAIATEVEDATALADERTEDA